MKSGDDKQRESERILNRISRETDGGSTLFDRAARRARNHFSAADKDPSDRIELLGARIGRVLGVVLLVGLTVYLALLLAGG